MLQVTVGETPQIFMVVGKRGELRGLLSAGVNVGVMPSEPLILRLC